MPSLYSHWTMRPHRRFFAVILTTIYLAIALSPLSPLAMHSKTVAHAITGECVGDCRICGCSPEASANHTCCCAKKKQMQAGVAKSSTGDCAPKTTASSEPAKKSCCAAPQPAEPVVAKNDCCAKNKQHKHDEIVQEAKHNEDQSNTGTTVLKCGCPCGKGKQLALTGIGSNELIPIINNERIELPHVTTLYTDPSRRMASRHGEPPDPPPRLSTIS